MRRWLAWLSALPLMLAGSQVAHTLDYRWIYPSSQVRLHALLSTGHSYMDQLPLALGIAGAVVLVSLLACLADLAHGRELRGPPAWAFAVLPLATFSLQEILERSLHTRAFVWQAVESPTFLPGLVLQLPFAALAYLIARLLLRSASVVARLIGTRPSIARPRRVPARVRLPLVLLLPRLSVMAAAAACRAPPVLMR